MSYYRLNTLVNNNEQEALKEMIFKRARERAQALVEDVQDSFTSSIQADVMDMARESFVSNNNPFSQKAGVIEEDTLSTEEREIGFAKRQVKDIKAQISSTNKVNNSELVSQQVESTMLEARNGLNNKQTFVGALDFLNSQATIALVKNKGKSFEAVA